MHDKCLGLAYASFRLSDSVKALTKAIKNTIGVNSQKGPHYCRLWCFDVNYQAPWLEGNTLLNLAAR